MTYGELLQLIEESRLSPERAAQIVGISGMTLRRWERKPRGEELPKLYAAACANGVYQMVAEGYLSPDSKLAQSALKDSGRAVSGSADKVLGLSKDFLEKAANNSDVLEGGLTQIGADLSHQRAVDDQQGKISAFRKWGKAWKSTIEGLTVVLNSKQLTLADKLVAYGAFFYLITPFDLIPDTIPGIGYLDDFAILSLALLYYQRRFKHLFPDKDVKS